ncbi:hypothetical protein [Methanoculleus sp. UBA303]|uniref:hypothetical protein n=1 Tax=Methanoculleus sp. UBA303 TaxID=1915497 RepID=UPI0025CBD267|nr:hypothetical protein [Methanoculleus sp. UBA303]
MVRDLLPRTAGISIVKRSTAPGSSIPTPGEAARAAVEQVYEKGPGVNGGEGSSEAAGYRIGCLRRQSPGGRPQLYF